MSAHTPAFPCEINPEQLESGLHQTGHMQLQQYGMTMRDYFAAKYMQGLCSTALYTDGNFTDDKLAAYAYQTADAMLQARESK